MVLSLAVASVPHCRAWASEAWYRWEPGGAPLGSGKCFKADSHLVPGCIKSATLSPIFHFPLSELWRLEVWPLNLQGLGPVLCSEECW